MAPVRPPPLDDKPLEPGLYVVATPIGNLRDITLRALDVLAKADLVLAEDTRMAGKLLGAYGLKAKVQRYDDHSGEAVRPGILKRLADGARIALTTDAGTPLVSDPGYRLVREAGLQGSAVIPIPGASAVLGPRDAVVARELTKLHETLARGPLDQLAADPSLQAPKGEVVVMVGPGAEAATSAADAEAALAEALSRLGPSEAAGEVARATGLSRRELYRRAVAMKSDRG